MSKPIRIATDGIVVIVCAALVLAACSSSGGTGGVKAAQARVSSKETAVADAQSAFDKASTEFCKNTETYITAIDRYGKVFDDSAATVGDVKTLGSDLENPREAVTSSAQDVVSSRDTLASAKKELADAQAALAAAEAEAAGSSTTSQPPTSSTSTTTTTLVPPATVDRVKQAEADLTAASQGITDQTPLARATVEYHSAAFALEVAWLRLFADAGCLTDEQQKKAEAALTEYTATLQTALKEAGYYTGEIDGIYGPSTVDAVKKLQTTGGLPVTGYVDRATGTALSNALLSKGGAAATQALANTAAVQSTLKLAGYWTGPVDGHWTPELTDALKAFQTHLGVPPTGEVDTATMAALESTIATAQTPPTTNPSPTGVSTSTTG
ncbi:MAG TPA: peptidoglycan-binding domain-containing protein [Acidimicrobiia bacterium]|nr:peptidoglycan-binding domain-containing protein [Acidimicrobiia bacterium]